MKLFSLCFPQERTGDHCNSAVCRVTATVPWWLMLALLLVLLPAESAYGQDIVDVLSKNCFVCHGPNVKPPMGGLAFSGSEALKKGAKRGPAIVPWKSAESLLFKAVSRTGELKMPPAGPISEGEVEVIRKWIDAGAVWPNKQAELHWAYRPVQKPQVPTVKRREWVANEIDAFVVAEYEKKNLRPAPLADRAALLRRVSYDLVGLPPTPAELALFVSGSSPNDYEKVVDRLLANEQHGVNYTRHWLDVLRYADVDEHMPASSGIYRWREWMIHALNRDMGYDQFVKMQLMGDLMDDPAAMFATGFLARGADVEKDEKRSLAFAAVETATTAFLGATVGCAKCHDHMFDPIRQADYYGLKAIFDPVVIEKKMLGGADQLALHAMAVENYERRKKELEKPLDEFLAPFKEKLQGERIRTFPPEIQEALKTPEEKRTPQQKKMADDYAPIIRIDTPKYKEIMTPEQIRIYDGLRAPLQDLAQPAEPENFWTVRENEELAKQKSFILDSGEPDRPKDEVGRMFHIGSDGFDVPPTPCEGKRFTTGGRQRFVEWMTHPRNPLFARVLVNRLWQWHFGVGLVKTSSDFGALSEAPSHPALLDWLASRLVESGYSMKSMNRLIVTSRTYQLASESNATSEAIDPDNRMLWRMPVRRLDAEELRDSVLWLAGKLDLKLGGKSFTELPDQYFVGSRVVIGNFNRETNRRAVYMVRGYNSTAEMMPNFFHVFDVDNGKLPNPVRNRSITALQALTLMNSPLVEEAAKDFGRRLMKLAENDLPKAVELGFKMALSRSPTPAEEAAVQKHLKSCNGCDSASQGAEKLGWLLLNLDEFLFVR
jgi:Protein of unknown function (DUF1553)/Protein of unknown function (DUF1549)/Planctomycete cytochrome C